jgi:hypothetical protein
MARLKFLFAASFQWSIHGVGSSGTGCSSLSSSSSTDYWTSVSACAPCVNAGCAFSLSSLLCGDDDGVADAATLVRGVVDACPSASARDSRALRNAARRTRRAPRAVPDTRGG